MTISKTPTGAIYGVTKYGEEYYGAQPTNQATFRWAVEVDWDGDGVFDGTSEAGRLTDILCTRGRKNWIQPNGQGFYPISVGVCHITLDNHDGRYDAWNTSSALYPNVTYGKDVRIRVVDVATDIEYNFFYGIISDIVPSGYGANAIVKITVEDGLRYLRNNYYEDYSGTNTNVFDLVDPLIGVGGAGYTQIWGSTISTSTDTIPYYFLPKRDICMNLMHDINTSFLSYFFIRADGVAKYMNKWDTSTGTITYDEEFLLKDVGNPFPWINYRNLVTAFISTWESTSTTYIKGSVTDGNYFQEFKYTPVLLQSTATANTQINLLLATFSAKNKTPTVQIENRPPYQFPELFDIAIVNIPALGVNNIQMRVGSIEHFGTPQRLRTIIQFEPKISTST